MNVVKLINELTSWHVDTEVMVDVAPVIKGCKTDYQWHDFTVAYENDKDEPRTLTIIKVKPKILGC